MVSMIITFFITRIFVNKGYKIVPDFFSECNILLKFKPRHYLTGFLHLVLVNKDYCLYRHINKITELVIIDNKRVVNPSI